MRLFLEGKREGKISTILELCEDGIIDHETGADKLNLSQDVFEYLYSLRRPKKKDAGEEP